jgi:hypothetical protein
MHFKNNIPCVKRGIELSQVCFSGGRVAASIANQGGLTHVDYFGEQRLGESRLFNGNDISAWTQLFRLCLGIGDNLYYLKFTDTEFYPFGYTSHFTAEGVTVRHGLYLLNDALVYRLEVLRNPRKRDISAVLFQMNGATRVDKSTRTWNGFESISTGNVWEATVIDQHTEPSKAQGNYGLTRTFPTEQVMRSETYVAVTSDRALRFENPNHFKHTLRSARFTREATFCVVFGHTNRARFHKRVQALRRSAPAEVARLLAGHRDSLQNPAISFSNPAVQSFVSNTRAMLNAMKPKDIPGGLRGANNGYWIWAWDSFVYSHTYLLLHDGAFAVEMLEFYKRHSDPEIGIAHAFTLDQKPFLPMAANAQCLYAVLLYDVYLFLGDKKVLRTYFDFALELVNRAGREEVKGTGLVRGPSLYPDAVDTLGETGDDISAINNSIYYQALCGLQALAMELNKEDVAADLKQRADRLQKNFDRLYDKEKGFFYTSISASDFKPRKFYAGHAVFWVTTFARDLVAPHAAPIARFIRKNLTMRHGYRLMPKWDQGYMRDGNNNGYYDPYMDRFYIEMMKLASGEKEIRKFSDDVAWYWSQFTVPEAMGAEMENHGITVDDPGKQQPFSMRVWCSIFFSTLMGLELDCDGLNFSACDAGPIEIRGLLIRGHTVDLKVTGRGWQIDKLLLDGKPVAAPFRIPFASLKKHSRIEVRRSSVRPSKKSVPKSKTHRS